MREPWWRKWLLLWLPELAVTIHIVSRVRKQREPIPGCSLLSVFYPSRLSALSMVLPRFGVVNLSGNTVNRCMQTYAFTVTLTPAELRVKINHHEECHPFVSCVAIFLRPFVHSKPVRVGCSNTCLGADSLNL